VEGLEQETGVEVDSTPRESECTAYLPSYRSVDEVLDDARLTVRGSVTRLGAETTTDPPATWPIWELTVQDPRGAEVPPTLTLVAGDRQSFAGPCGPLAADGQSGIYFLDWNDRAVPDLPGRVYYPVAILEETELGFRDVGEVLDPVALEDELSAIVADNGGA
jgi:hypothetical protein